MVDISGQPELAAAKACGGGKSNKSRLVKVVGNTGSKSGGNQKINVCFIVKWEKLSKQKELFKVDLNFWGRNWL